MMSDLASKMMGSQMEAEEDMGGKQAQVTGFL